MTVLLFKAEKRCRYAIAKRPAGIGDIRRPDDVVDQVPVAILETDQSGIRKSVHGFPPVSRSNLKEPITFMTWVALTQIIVILCEHRPTIHHLGLGAQPGLRKIDRAAAGTLRLHLHEGPVGRGAHRRETNSTGPCISASTAGRIASRIAARSALPLAGSRKGCAIEAPASQRLASAAIERERPTDTLKRRPDPECAEPGRGRSCPDASASACWLRRWPCAWHPCPCRIALRRSSRGCRPS